MSQDDSSLLALLLSFLALIIASAYFSSSETGMMSLNRYRLRHLARSNHAGAKRASKLLESPDKLIGVILIGNNFVNFLAASIATSIAIALFGDPSPILTAVVLTLVVLIFAEVTPKTIAALHPEKIAYPSSLLLALLLKLLYPVVWIVNVVSNALVRLIGFSSEANGNENQLTPEELRTVVYESGGRIPRRRHGMLMNILDLERVTVDDILVPRHELVGIDIEDDLNDILLQISSAQHTRLPVYKHDIDNIVGVLHLRSTGKLIGIEELNKSALLQETAEPYFIPESTPLHTQLFNFQKKKERMAVVVDEYGAVKGIITLEDILEEIVGEFTTDLAASSKDIHPQEDGSFLIDGSASVRDINKVLSWDLESSGAKTLNGLLTESLESIPDSSVCINLDGYYAEIVQVKDNVIKTVKMWRAPQAQLDDGIDG
ncbi:MAG: HlyC/CorC family transporter [Proteobacteria bacterium]|jgi:Mg2+/Co2+ transporter CorB|nr:HlyC/CorC family transporter [Pseudomonadales bacterium]MDA0805229.1 HlyC/CorC family transporter [Pseudomonadota bacterium]MDA0896190.1 HlyC/CorC family transporter [Pseudomonadota bacterium]MDP4782438.1 HlyC/CorC family transporter [Gammaproteobacteria bacterium]